MVLYLNNSLNNISTQVTEFLMICFPGMQDTQHWLSIVLAPLFIVALGANFVLLLAIWQEASLHEPMYYLLVVLSILDVILCLTVIPKVSPSLNKLSGTQLSFSNQYLFSAVNPPTLEGKSSVSSLHHHIRSITAPGYVPSHF